MEVSTFCRALICWATAYGIHNSYSTSRRISRVVLVRFLRVYFVLYFWYVKQSRIGKIKVRTTRFTCVDTIRPNLFETSLAFSSCSSFSQEATFLKCSLMSRLNIVMTEILTIMWSVRRGQKEMFQVFGLVILNTHEGFPFLPIAWTFSVFVEFLRRNFSTAPVVGQTGLKASAIEEWTRVRSTCIQNRCWYFLRYIDLLVLTLT